MRQVRAKAIRREVYGDMADQRKYWRHDKSGQIMTAPDGLRRKYQDAKKRYKRA